MMWELKSSWCAITLSVAVIMARTFHVKSRFFAHNWFYILLEQSKKKIFWQFFN